MFRLSSEVVTATASQLSIPALPGSLNPWGNPTEVTPRNPRQTAQYCLHFHRSPPRHVRRRPASRRLCGPKAPPMTRIFIHVPVPFLPGSLRALISLCRGRETAGNACTAPAADFPILNPDGVPFPRTERSPLGSSGLSVLGIPGDAGAVVALLSGALESGRRAFF